MRSRRLLAAAPPLFIGVSFIVAVLVILTLSGGKAWAPSDVISLLTGAVTAAGLFALSLQVRTAQEDAQERENQRALEMAVRADQLHMEFNIESMREHRDLAYSHLKSLRDNPKLLRTFAEYWIYDKKDAYLPLGQAEATPKPDWSVSIMIAFFVRLSSHVKFYDDRVNQLNAEDMSRLIGPFFWIYWAEAGIKALVDECAKLEKEKPSPFGLPYFINPLRELEKFSDRAKGIKLEPRQGGSEQQQGLVRVQ
jgi:hypothetical protein